MMSNQHQEGGRNEVHALKDGRQIHNEIGRRASPISMVYSRQQQLVIRQGSAEAAREVGVASLGRGLVAVVGHAKAKPYVYYVYIYICIIIYTSG